MPSNSQRRLEADIDVLVRSAIDLAHTVGVGFPKPALPPQGTEDASQRVRSLDPFQYLRCALASLSPRRMRNSRSIAIAEILMPSLLMVAGRRDIWQVCLAPRPDRAVGLASSRSAGRDAGATETATLQVGHARCPTKAMSSVSAA